MFNELHKRKIDMADEVLIINTQGWIGQSTKNEIEYAKSHNKIIRYYFSDEQITKQLL
jgi:hypothetical protein